MNFEQQIVDMDDDFANGGRQAMQECNSKPEKNRPKDLHALPINRKLKRKHKFNSLIQIEFQKDMERSGGECKKMKCREVQV